MSSFVKASGNITPNSADPGEEFPFLHTITVVDRVVSVDKPELVQNNIKTETVTLNLDSEWEGLSTVINIGNEWPVSVIWSGALETLGKAANPRTSRRVARVRAADRRARRLPRGRQNHLQRQTLYVHLRRLCVDPGRLSAGVAAR